VRNHSNLKRAYRYGLCLSMATLLLVAGCGKKTEAETGHDENNEHAEAAGEEGVIILSADQIRNSHISLGRPNVGGVQSALEVSAIIAADPALTQSVPAAIGGRVVTMSRNLGEPVARGTALAVIESQDAARLKAEVQAARQQVTLAQSNFTREERLWKEKVSAEQDYLAAKNELSQAQIRLQLAEGQLSAAGGGGGGALNRITVASPVSGQIIGRSALLGQTVDADTELYRVADLSRVSIDLALSPDSAARVRPGAQVDITAGDRAATGRVTFVSPVIDAETRQVRAVATLANTNGLWLVGETVKAIVSQPGNGSRNITVPNTAIQTVEGKPSVFVRTKTGFKVTPVTLGQAAGAHVAILGGLNGSEEIAIVNTYTLKAEAGKGEAGDHD